jgi:hypothetical protein
MNNKILPQGKHMGESLLRVKYTDPEYLLELMEKNKEWRDRVKQCLETKDDWMEVYFEFKEYGQKEGDGLRFMEEVYNKYYDKYPL